MAELVGEHGFELIPAQNGDDAPCDGDGGMRRVAPGGERVGRIRVDHVDPRLWQTRVHRKAVHDRVQLGLFGLGDLFRAGQRNDAGAKRIDPRAAVGAEHRLAAQEDAGERVVVSGRDRIEFVIMAFRAVHGQA